MAVSNAALNRSQEWSSDEKKVLRKIFDLAQTAATSSTSSVISPTVVHTTCAGKLSAQEELDIRALMNGIRGAIDATDNTYDVVPHTTAFRMNGEKKKIIRVMAEAVVAQIV